MYSGQCEDLADAVVILLCFVYEMKKNGKKNANVSQITCIDQSCFSDFARFLHFMSVLTTGLRVITIVRRCTELGILRKNAT